jgi:hypothetical protein
MLENGWPSPLHETANPERSGDAKPTGLSESAGLPKETRMKTKKNIKIRSGIKAGPIAVIKP